MSKELEGFKQGDLVTIDCDCNFDKLPAEVIYIHEDRQFIDGRIEVQFWNGIKSNYIFQLDQPEDRRKRFEPFELIKGYEPDFESDAGCHMVFGRTWMSRYVQKSCSLVCAHEDCNEKAVFTAWVNCTGSINPYDVCEEHKSYHKKLVDWFPSKREEVQEDLKNT